jgi:Holliday junction resolvasome RuvABC endonuclease subunit
MKIILSLDPAESTGFSVAQIDGDSCVIVEYGFIDVDTSSTYIGDWCIDLQNKIELIYNRVKPTDIVVEDYFFGSKFSSGANVNTAYRTAIHIWCRLKNVHYEILNISNWKVFVAGRSMPTKEQKQKWGKQPAKKIMIVEALWKRWKIRFPNHSLSSKTSKPIMFRYDVADAVAQAMYGSFLLYNCKNYSCSVAIPPDVEFKKNSKKMFAYDEQV